MKLNARKYYYLRENSHVAGFLLKYCNNVIVCHGIPY